VSCYIFNQFLNYKISLQTYFFASSLQAVFIHNWEHTTLSIFFNETWEEQIDS